MKIEPIIEEIHKIEKLRREFFKRIAVKIEKIIKIGIVKIKIT